MNLTPPQVTVAQKRALAGPLPARARAVRGLRPGLTPFEQEVVEIFIGLAQVAGLPKSYGEIYGLLYATEQPLSFNDIHGRLGLSKGSVSQGLNALRGVGAVKVKDMPDDRRDYFAPETELRMLMAGFLGEVIAPQLKKGRARLDQVRLCAAATGGPRGGNGQVIKGRLDKLERWHRQAGALLPWINKFLG